MCDVLSAVLRPVDSGPAPILGHDELAPVPIDLRVALQDAGILQRTHPAEQASCLECGEYEDVAWITTADSGSVVYVRCRQAGPYRISPERLEQWTVSTVGLIEFLAAVFEIRGQRSELVRDHVWLLGRTGIAGASRNVYFARGLHRSDLARAFDRIRVYDQSLVLVPHRTPTDEALKNKRQVVVPLTQLLDWNGEAITCRHDFAAGQLECNRATRCRRRSSGRRSERLATIEALQRELEEHLRAARDHAHDTLDRTGTPRLLPRPTKKFLAKKLRIHESSVCRAFADESARELRFLWDLAADLDRILCHSAVGR